MVAGMDQTPIDLSQCRPGGALPDPDRARFGQAAASLLALRWVALHDAADIVAGIAGLPQDPPRAELIDFPSAMHDAGGWRQELAEQGVADMSAMMLPGLSALLQANARGAVPVAAARALWQEFAMARDCLLALMPHEDQPGSMRFT